MRLFVLKSVRRIISLIALLFVSVPFGLSIVGCGHHTTPPVYCNGGDTGPTVGQLVSLQLSPNFATTGESLNYGQIGTGLSAVGYDCKNNVVGTGHIVYGTSNMNLADVNPSNGQACGGTWNRNTGGGIANYTICSPPAAAAIGSGTSVAYITANTGGVTSNAIPVYVHPTITDITFGPGASCSSDPDTTCCPASPTTLVTGIPPYNGNSCVSQNDQAQVAVRAYTNGTQPAYAISGWNVVPGAGTVFIAAGTTVPPVGSVVTLSGFVNPCPPGSPSTCVAPDPTFLNGQTGFVTATQTTTSPYTFTVSNSFGQTAANGSSGEGGTASSTNNISCEVGHFTFGTPVAGNIVSFDQNGVATANQPGSTILTAALSNSSNASTVGFFSTCPPASIQITPVGQSTSSTLSVPLNNTQPFTASVLDTAGNPITGLTLEWESTTPQTIPAASGSVTPTYPGTATITAICQPPSCNPAPFSQLGYLGNGKPVTSNGIEVTSPGASSTVIYIGSTQSQYLLPVDFSTGLAGSLLKLPFVPNSMVISQDGSTIYLGSPEGLMTFSTSSGTVSSTNALVQGTVLSVSPDNSTVVVTDPTRSTISLVVGGAASTTYGGIATHAQWSPDSQTVYLTLAPSSGGASSSIVLTHSAYTNWQPTPITPSLATPPTSGDTSYNDVAVTVPAIGAYFAGSATTDGRTYCALTTESAAGTPPTESNLFTPVADVKPVATDRLAATADGKHILGASVAAGMSDIYITNPQPPSSFPTPYTCTTTTGKTQTEAPAIGFNTTAGAPQPFTALGITPTVIDGVLPASNSEIAFVTYAGAGGKLPYYLPSSSGAAGTLNALPLTAASGSTAPAAPVAGTFSTDNYTFYVGTSGDNLVHLITLTYPAGAAPTLTDSSQINPQLPNASGTGNVTPNLIVQRPKHSQS